MATRSGRSEAKRRLRASGLVRSLPSSITSPLCVSVAEVQSGCHRWLFAANIHGGPILLSIGPLRAHTTFADPKGYCAGGRPSHLIFLELRRSEVPRTPLPGTWVNSSQG